MQRTMRLMAMAVLMVAGCGPQGAKSETDADVTKRMQDEAAAARGAIDASNARYMTHFNAVHGDSVAALFVEDGRMMAPNAPPAVGRAAIAGGMAMLANTKPTITLTTLSVEANGPLAIEVGTYHLVLQPPGATAAITDTGKYLVHWRKLGDHWMMVDQIWNSDIMSPGMKP